MLHCTAYVVSLTTIGWVIDCTSLLSEPGGCSSCAMQWWRHSSCSCRWWQCFRLSVVVVIKAVRISEIKFGFRYKISEPSKNLTSAQRRFSDRNCVQSAIQIKSDKNNFSCIQCATKEHFKTRRKPSLAYRFLECSYITYLLSLMSVYNCTIHHLQING